MGPSEHEVNMHHHDGNKVMVQKAQHEESQSLHQAWSPSEMHIKVPEADLVQVCVSNQQGGMALTMSLMRDAAGTRNCSSKRRQIPSN